MVCKLAEVGAALPRMHESAAAQIQEAAEDAGPELLETWLILEYCDQGSFDHAIRSGKFNKDLVGNPPACMPNHLMRTSVVLKDRASASLVKGLVGCQMHACQEAAHILFCRSGMFSDNVP